MGFQLSRDGASPKPSMVEANTKMPTPLDQHDVQRYLGMLNFLARFCLKLSDVMKPLRDLACKDVPFKWTDAHAKPFVESKNLVAHAPVLRYFKSSSACHPSGRCICCRSGWSPPPSGIYSNTLTGTEEKMRYY